MGMQRRWAQELSAALICLKEGGGQHQDRREAASSRNIATSCMQLKRKQNR
jgi:hypothetical protein